jgi:hypothetical protein
MNIKTAGSPLMFALKNANVQIMAGLIFALLPISSPGLETGPTPITGRWQIDASISTKAEDVLKKIRKSKRKKRSDKDPYQQSESGNDTQRRYWQRANGGEQWRHSRELEHTGPLQRLLESENLEIVETEKGYVFIYADGYEREIVPNPAGRVFTASGNELVETGIGHTLAYWHEATLKFETGTKGGGKLSEQITLSADGERLTVSIEIDRRDWKWIAKVKRIFERVALDSAE